MKKSAAARHILVNDEQTCAQLKKDIEGGADFAVVAREHSTCPSARQGGDLGEFSPGEMVREFDTVVFSAPLTLGVCVPQKSCGAVAHGTSGPPG